MKTEEEKKELAAKILIAANEFANLAEANDTDTLTCEVFVKALSMNALMVAKGLSESKAMAASLVLEVHPREFLEWRQLTETYVGITSVLDSRIDIAYLAKVPLMVLVGCMPAIRRADFLVEQGKFTSVVVSRDKILVPVAMQSSSEVYVSDIRCWQSADCAAIAAPYSSSMTRQVSQGHCEQMVFLDNIVTDEPLPPFVLNGRVPNYINPKHRYYDLMAGGSGVPMEFKIVDLTREFSMAQ
jgi:hypothetical protein